MKDIAASQPSTDHEKLRRLASFAIARNQFTALARHLSGGLDPNALCYAGAEMDEYHTLLEAAANHDAMECVQALLKAGAVLTPRTIEWAFEPRGFNVNDFGEQCLVLQSLIASGHIDPFGVVWHGCTSEELAIGSRHPAALSIIMAAQAQQERLELDQSVSSVCHRAPRRPKSI